MLTFDVFGNDSPHGNTVTYPSPVASIAVTFRTTAVAELGTPANPAMTTGLYEPAPGLSVVRVSNTRSGETPRNADAPTGAADTDSVPSIGATMNVATTSNAATNCRPSIDHGLTAVWRSFIIRPQSSRRARFAQTIHNLNLISLL